MLSQGASRKRTSLILRDTRNKRTLSMLHRQYIVDLAVLLLFLVVCLPSHFYVMTTNELSLSLFLFPDRVRKREIRLHQSRPRLRAINRRVIKMTQLVLCI